jgi:hypothetical protein
LEHGPDVAELHVDKRDEEALHMGIVVGRRELAD